MKLLTTIKNFFRRQWQSIAGFFMLLGKWFVSIWYVFLSTQSKPREFIGWGHFWFARKYADRRTRISKVNKYCGGKFHYVIPWGNYSLIVVSSDEIRNGQAKGIINKHLSIDKILKSAYYVSTDKNSKPKIKN